MCAIVWKRKAEDMSPFSRNEPGGYLLCSEGRSSHCKMGSKTPCQASQRIS